METQKNTKGMYINKTYLWNSTDKPSATYIKNWVATIRKNLGVSNQITHQWVKWIHNVTGKTHCFFCLRLHECWFSSAKR